MCSDDSKTSIKRSLLAALKGATLVMPRIQSAALIASLDASHASLTLGDAAVAAKLLLESELRGAKAELRDLRTTTEASLDERIAEVAGDHPTAELLRQMAKSGWVSPFINQRFYDLNLRMNGREYLVRVPAKHGPWAVFETLILGLYNHLPIVELHEIYDCGAFIGLSALYLHSLYPNARLVCIEPAPANRLYLEQNLANNVFNYEVIPHALGPESATVPFHCGASPSMLNSTVLAIEPDRASLAKCISLRELRPAPEYAIKLDIEGAEYDLIGDKEVLRHATWIMGELHYGSFLTQADAWLMSFFADTFPHVALGNPKIDIYENMTLLAQSFCAGTKF